MLFSRFSLFATFVAGSLAVPSLAQNRVVRQDFTRNEPAVYNQSLVRLSILQKVGAARVGATYRGARVQRIFPLTKWALVEWQNAMTKLPNGTLVKSSALQTATRAISVFGQNNAVPNGQIKLAAIPNDPGYGRQWWPNRIGAPVAWDVQTSAETPIIAVLDTGAQLSHPDLSENLWVNPREVAGNGIDDDGNGFVDDIHGVSVVNNPTSGENEINGVPNDTNGHGTHITGILAARGNNGREVAGAVWRARVLPVRFIGTSGFGTDAAILSGLEYILALKRRGENIRITSNSWETRIANPAIEAAFNQLESLGVLSFCAAGNGNALGAGLDLDNPANATFPASYPSAGIIAVAASTPDDSRAIFSNFGRQTVDIAAPGTNIFSLGLTSEGQTLSGTSQAAPLVAGAAALLWERFPSLSASQVRQQILAAVTPTAEWQNSVASGGRLDMGALFSSLRTQSRLSGVVTRDGGIPLQGARVQLGEQVVFTAANGTFNFPSIAPSTQTLSATFPGLNFAPQTLVFGLPGVDVTANLNGTTNGSLYTVSGSATNSAGVRLSGVDVLVAGWEVPLAQTNANGDYSFAVGAGLYTFAARRGSEVFVATPASLRFPSETNPAQTAFTVNFSLPLLVGDAPTFTGANPPTGGAASVQFTLSDPDGVRRVFFQLSRSEAGVRSFYNWGAGSWVANMSDPATVASQDTSGTTPTISRALPALGSGQFVLKAWAVDNRGNETPIGAETFVRWTN